VTKPETLYEFDKCGGQVVRFSVGHYRGRKYADVRLWYEDDEGQFKPTKKGIALAPELLNELEKGVMRLKAALGRQHDGRG
jgi:hypothetical protein